MSDPKFQSEKQAANQLENLDKAIAGISSQLNWLVDAIIPSDPDLNMASATEVGVLETYLKQSLTKRDDLREVFLAAVAKLPQDKPDKPLEVLRALGSADFDCCTRVIAGSYFMDEGVNKTLKYPGQLENIETPDYDLIVDRVQSVIDRGQIYVSTA